MSFLYPRNVTVSRIVPLVAGGVQGARVGQGDTPVAGLGGLPANIRQLAIGQAPLGQVPADEVGRTLWRILLPGNVAAAGTIHKDDFATDDLGRRFKLMMPDWKSGLGIQIDAELMMA